MKNHVLFSLPCLIAIVACSTPPKPTPAPAAPAVVGAPDAARPGKQAPSADVAAGAQTDVVSFAKSHGYRASIRSGKPVWCKHETPLGTHFESNVCVDDNFIAEQMRTADAQQSAMRAACSGTGCVGK